MNIHDQHTSSLVHISREVLTDSQLLGDGKVLNRCEVHVPSVQNSKQTTRRLCLEFYSTTDIETFLLSVVVNCLMLSIIVDSLSIRHAAVVLTFMFLPAVMFAIILPACIFKSCQISVTNCIRASQLISFFCAQAGLEV